MLIEIRFQLEDTSRRVSSVSRRKAVLADGNERGFGGRGVAELRQVTGGSGSPGRLGRQFLLEHAQFGERFDVVVGRQNAKTVALGLRIVGSTLENLVARPGDIG